MVTTSHTLDWTSADCQLRWQSPKSHNKPENIYIRLWGLIHTINTTEEQYLQQLQTCQDIEQKARITEHLIAKQTHYPDDNYPLIAFHPTDTSYHNVKLKQGEILPVTLVFGGAYQHLASDWLRWFAVRLTLENTGFSLVNTPTLAQHQVSLSPLTATKLAKYQQAVTDGDEITLLLDMPANLTPSKSLSKQLQHASQADIIKQTLLAHSEKRLCQWFVSQQDVIQKWFASWRGVLGDSPICTYQLHERHGIKTQSKSSQPAKSKASTKQTQYHHGHAGWLTLKGAWTQVPELWQVLASIHLLGQRTQINGLGYFLTTAQLQRTPPTLWQRHISDPRHIRHAISEVLSRYELEPVVDKAGKIMEEDGLTELIHTQLTTHTYQPQPTHAIHIAKPSGGTRQIEELSQLDMMVHRLVFNAIAKLTDEQQSPLSLGYRKGYSRQMAQGKVQQLIQAGYNWVIEADIEAFFDNVPFDRLWQRLGEVLPQREKQTILLIKQLMQVSYITSNRTGNKLTEHTRDKGLMQGSPLSPVLANLYLAQLDGQISAEHLAFVRYADDVLIFCRSQHSASETLQWLGERLTELGLTLSLNKSQITSVSAGFEFLGYRFDKEGGQDKSALPILRQRKPVMITGNRKYLGVNGAALEIREKRPRKKSGLSLAKSPLTNQLVQVIPLRRISQLMVIGNHAVSSPLLSACAKANVSVHMVNQWGFQVGTFTPSTAEYYAVSAKQYQRHQILKPSQMLAIAADLVIAKLNNYQTWITNSYRKGDAQVIKRLEQLKEQASSSTTTQQLMGYEGTAAKLCFGRLQSVMIAEQQPAFASKRRSRGGVDKLNSLLNFGYYWLFTRISSLLHSHGLNPYLSYLHEPEQRYETLVYDVMELFRVQVDKTVLRLINRKQIQPRDFQLHPKKGWQLNNDSLHLYSNQLQATLASKINHTYLEDIILMQVRNLHAWATSGQSLTWFYWYADKQNKAFALPDSEPQMMVIDSLANQPVMKP